MREDLLTLPATPGTVIAIGEWWLVRLRPLEGAPSAWELLPMPNKDTADRVKSLGVATQCVYGDDWVRAEVEQEGSYLVVSEPVARPYGVRYFSPKPHGAEPTDL